MMNYMFQVGFFGTRAPFFMDFVTFVVALLPFLVGLAISFARKKDYNLHRTVHIVLLIVSVLVVGYFEYGVRVGGGYAVFAKGSSVSSYYLLIVLIGHIIISVVTLGVWISTTIKAVKDYEQGLPGPYTRSHKRAGLRTFIGIVLTSLTGVWVYCLLFIF